MHAAFHDLYDRQPRIFSISYAGYIRLWLLGIGLMVAVQAPAQSKAHLELRSQLDSAHQFLIDSPSKALSILKKNSLIEEEDLKIQADYFRSLGISYYYLNEFDLSLENFLKALSLCQRIGDDAMVAACYNALGNVFFGSGDPHQAIAYYQRSLELKRLIGNPHEIENTLGNMGSLYTDHGDYQSAEACLREALSSAEGRLAYTSAATILNILGTMYTAQKHYDAALECNLSAYQKIETLPTAERQRIYITNSITYILILLKRLDEASIYLHRAMTCVQSYASDDMRLFAYRNAMHYYAARGDWERHLQYFNQYDSIRNCIFSNEKTEKLAEVQIKYETAETAKENALQKLKLAQKENMQYFYFSICTVTLVLLFVFYGRYRLKLRTNQRLEEEVRKRTETLVKETERRQKLERQLLQVAVETEERERAFFAEELHDSLGPLLSTIRIYTDLIAEESAKERREPNEHLSTIQELLENAVQSTREIANKLLPSVLRDFGLMIALQNLTQNIVKTGVVKIHLSGQGMERRLDLRVEKAFFRVGSELIHNALKHAHAKHISMSFAIRDGRLFFVYGDDGIGFDLKEQVRQQTHGSGISNIYMRMQAIGAHCRLTSQVGHGTQFQATLGLTNN